MASNLTWLVLSLTVAVLVRSPLRFDFKYDLMKKHDVNREGDNCVHAVFLYRMSNFFSRHHARVLAEQLHALAKLITHADISPHSDDVSLWARANVAGKVSVGDRAEVGANAVVTEDVPPDHIVLGVPATRQTIEQHASVG